MKTIRELTKLSNGKELDIKYPIELKDKDGRVVYSENSNGYWEKREYDTDDNAVYHEDYSGFGWKKEPKDSPNKELVRLIHQLTETLNAIERRLTC